MSETTIAVERAEALRARMLASIDAHCDPRWGSLFWQDRVRTLGLDPRREIREFEDLALLGELTSADLRRRSVLDFVPRRLRERPTDLLFAQTGGSTGEAVWTPYTRDEFEAAFVTPFVEAARHVGFPKGLGWLYAGPSGPHIIGRAAMRLPVAMGGPPPLCVDLDPRWARRLPQGSFSALRYMSHVVEQCLDILQSQPIGVIFTTPPIAQALGEAMGDRARAAIAGMHYGGMALTPSSLDALEQLFPDAVHLSGYGNTLLGCCLELDLSRAGRLCYFPHGDRLRFDLIDDDGEPARGEGRVRVSRFDESCLLINLRERDVASPVARPDGAPTGFASVGLRDPHTPRSILPTAPGLY